MQQVTQKLTCTSQSHGLGQHRHELERVHLHVVEARNSRRATQGLPPHRLVSVDELALSYCSNLDPA